MTVRTTEDQPPSVVRLAALVKTARERRGWSIRQLARQTGLSHATLARLENAQIDPRLSVVLRVLSSLDLVRKDTMKIALSA